jgi:hypothetical protein
MVAFMTPFVFDTLSASKQLREAGMAEGMAEAVVSVFQHAATMPDISHLATKADLDALGVATKADLDALSVATKADLDALSVATKTGLDALSAATKADLDALSAATKADLEALRLATKAEFEFVKADIDALRSDMATKVELEAFKVETQAEFKMVRLEIKGSADAIRAEINEKFRQQTLAIIGGMAVMLTIATTAGRLFG